MRSNEIENYKKTLKLSELQRQVLVGTLLGDGCLETQNQGRTYRLKIEHSFSQKSYVDWKYEIFKNWVLTEPIVKEHKSYGLLRKNYRFSTVSSGSFRFYGQQFYKKDGKKIIPKLISKMLSPLVLAVWFMDDGSIKSNKHKALVIHTQSFTKEDLIRIIQVLENKYGIKSTLRSRDTGGGYAIYILSKTVNKLIDLVKSYFLPSMRYKLGNTIA